MTYEQKDYVAGRGTTALGIIGTVLGSLGVAGNGLLGGVQTASTHPQMTTCGCPETRFVTRYEQEQAQIIAAKDAEIGLLKADQYTDAKLVDVYKDLNAKYNALSDKINANRDEQQQINAAQATYNGVNSATLNCMQNSLNQLFGLTKLVVPNTSVCPGWGNVTITPSTTAATA